MTPLPSTTKEASAAIGKLCVGGDWACARGDLDELREIVRQLEDYVPEPMHCELEKVVATCASEPERAVSLWDALKDRIYRDLAPHFGSSTLSIT